MTNKLNGKWLLLLLAILALALCAGCGGAGADPNAPTCTVSVDCGVLVDNPALSADKAELVPADGVLLADTETAFAEGDSALDVVLAALREAGLTYEVETAYNYIQGVNNLYEGDAGELSGWLFIYNGEIPSQGAGEILVQDGDTIRIAYSCDFGEDLGFTF